MLELEGISRRYGDVVALDNLSVAIPPGEVFGLLGPNGAGKTTAMRVVLGIVAADAGEVRYDGRRLTPDDRARFGYLPEERGLYPGMAVADHLVYVGRLHGMSARDAAMSTARWLERLSIADRARSKVSALSLGNQQRVQLAAALVHSPRVLVLDEPFSGLDPIGTDTMAGVLDDAAASGATVVFSSHQLDLVESRCRSVAILHKGRLVAAGPVYDLATSGRRRLVVEVDAESNGWVASIAGVAVSESAGNRLRLVLDDGVDPQRVLAEAQRHGAIVHFAFDRRRLSEVFREAVGA